MKKNYKELMSNTAVFAISNLLSKALLMLLLPVYTNKLTAEQYGVIELATNVSLLVMPFVSLAIQDAVFRFTVDKSIEDRLVFKNSFWVLAFGIIMLLMVSACLYFYSPLQEWRWWFWGFTSLNMTRSALSLYAKGTGKSKVFAIDGVLYNAVLTGANILLLVVIRMKVDGYFLALIIAQLFSIFYLLWNVTKPKLSELFSFSLDNESLMKMLKYSAPLILNSISWNLAHTVDRLMLEGMSSMANVGIYSAASKIPSLISTIMNIFIQAWTISAIKNFEDEEGKKFYAQVFKYVQFILVLVTLSVLLINNRIVIVLFGGDFKQTIQYTPILMIATSALFYANYFGPVFSSVQMSKTLMKTTLLGTVINVILNYFLIETWGIYGACIATLVSNAVVSISRIFFSRKIYYFRINWIPFIIGWLSISIACLMTMLRRQYAEIIDLVLIVIMLLTYREQIAGLIQHMRNKMKGQSI